MNAYLPADDLGKLFIDVQLAKIFPDAKTFVDCIPLQAPAIIVSIYQGEKGTAGFLLSDFVHRHFKLPYTPIAIAIANSANMISHLHQHWPQLVKESNSTEQWDSLIHLPYPYVVPGGRFREMFYWDSYFTIIGLLESGENELAFGMLRNFDYLINRYGYIPNGNRSYFLSRSQPPFFAEMLKAYAKKHGMNSIIPFLPALQKEYNFWTKDNPTVNAANPVAGKSVWLDGQVLQRYSGAFGRPRPEAYNKEYLWAQELPEADRPNFYLHLQAACESGWDFSSRWFADGKNRTAIQCENLIPICLNSLLFNCEKQLSIMHSYHGNAAKADEYQALSNARKSAINQYCWCETLQVFTDYQFKTFTANPVISLATVYPLFFGMATQLQADKIAAIIENDFLKEGGVVTTLNTSGEQWDAPNGWAPLQWLTVIGLARYGHHELAKTIATRWLIINETVYQAEGKMMEKYNVVHTAMPGGGGNYPNQDGFGWTNGVALALHSWLRKNDLINRANEYV